MLYKYNSYNPLDWNFYSTYIDLSDFIKITKIRPALTKTFLHKHVILWSKEYRE